MQQTQPYTPPPGYYDLPFTWAFDASIFTNGSSPLGSSIYLLGGYGDFLLRRVVGLNRILAANGTGMFQISRKFRNVYLSSDPVQAPNTPEFAVAPEELYLETGKIWFDLYGISLPNPSVTAQLAFQGVRRMQGHIPTRAISFPKTYTYQVAAALQNGIGSAPVTTFTKIVDYDFELYQIILIQQNNAELLVGSAPGLVRARKNVRFGLGGNTFLFVANQPGPAGALISVAIFDQLPATVPFQITVAGNAISVQLGSNVNGILPTMTADFVTAALNANSAVSSLVTVYSLGNGGQAGETPGGLPAFLAGGTLAPITTPISALTVYDSNKVAISNAPILDIFYNGGPGSPYVNGAIVPPLLYPKDSVLEIDFTSLTNSVPTTVVAYLVGRQLIPCS